MNDMRDIIESEGARAWRRGVAFWHVPDYRTKRDRQTWAIGYDRACAEFYPTDAMQNAASAFRSQWLGPR